MGLALMQDPGGRQGPCVGDMSSDTKLRGHQRSWAWLLKRILAIQVGCPSPEARLLVYAANQSKPEQAGGGSGRADPQMPCVGGCLLRPISGEAGSVLEAWVLSVWSRNQRPVAARWGRWQGLLEVSSDLALASKASCILPANRDPRTKMNTAESSVLSGSCQSGGVTELTIMTENDACCDRREHSSERD